MAAGSDGTGLPWAGGAVAAVAVLSRPVVPPVTFGPAGWPTPSSGRAAGRTSTSGSSLTVVVAAGGAASGDVQGATTAVPITAAARLCAGGGTHAMILAHGAVRRR